MNIFSSLYGKSRTLIPFSCNQMKAYNEWLVNLRLQGLGHRTNLVHFEQQTVAGLLLHCFGDALGVSHSQVVPNHLNVCSVCKAGPGLPVILVKGILNRHHFGIRGGRGGREKKNVNNWTSEQRVKALAKCHQWINVNNVTWIHFKAHMLLSKQFRAQSLAD